MVNNRNLTNKSTFSNNLFHLQKKEASEVAMPVSGAADSVAAKQDVNESFNTAKMEEEIEDNSRTKDKILLKMDASMDGPGQTGEVAGAHQLLPSKSRSSTRFPDK